MPRLDLQLLYFLSSVLKGIGSYIIFHQYFKAGDYSCDFVLVMRLIGYSPNK